MILLYTKLINVRLFSFFETLSDVIGHIFSLKNDLYFVGNVNIKYNVCFLFRT